MKALFLAPILIISFVFVAGTADRLVYAGEDVNVRSVDVEGTVSFADGIPADGADVRCQRPNGDVIATTTVGGNGRFRFTNLFLTVGSYDILADLVGVTNVERITVTQETTSALRLIVILPVMSPAQKGEGNTAVVRVFYATDRALSAAPPVDYTEQRSSGGQLRYGHCDVSIPRDHKLAAIERPSIWRFEFSEDPNKHIVIQSLTQLDRDLFLKQLSTAIARSDGRELVVFVHGYNVAFKDAVYRTAQIAYDLGLDGVPVAYSWPSNGKLLSYVEDTNNVRWTSQHLLAFLTDLASHSHAKAIHLIAHSMGSRCASEAPSWFKAGSGR